MKISRRSPALLASAFLLGGTVVTMAGCAGSDKGKPPLAPPSACRPAGVARPGVPVTVYVEYDGAARTARTANKQVYMCEQDWVLWQSNDGEFEDPKFPGGSPFDKPFKRGHRSLTSEKPKRGAAHHRYDYTIGLVVGTNPAVDVDPSIEVME